MIVFLQIFSVAGINFEYNDFPVLIGKAIVDNNLFIILTFYLLVKHWMSLALKAISSYQQTQSELLSPVNVVEFAAASISMKSRQFKPGEIYGSAANQIHHDFWPMVYYDNN